MTIASSDALLAHAALRRRLRDLPGLQERRPGVFEAGGRPLIELHARDDRVVAVMHARDWPIDTAVDQRKLVDEAKRRIAVRDE